MIKKNKIFPILINWVFIVLFAAVSLFGFDSCKAKKELANAIKLEEQMRSANIDQSKRQLLNIINAEGKNLPLDKYRRIIKDIRELNLGDDEVNRLIGRAEDKIKAVEEAIADEERRKLNELNELQQPLKVRLESAFSQLSQSQSNADGKRVLQNALTFFQEEDVPVLIIIRQSTEVVDYDKPTTIFRYLQYLKDTGVNRNKVDSMKTNADGKITELILKRR